MQRALLHAERGLGRTSPNPVVGACVVTPEGVVVGDGAHERAGGPHAEVHALNEAGDRARGATLYCTLEPCVHTGRTGPCTDRILEAGVRRVVAAVDDPDPRMRGRGFRALEQRGVRVDVGTCREEAIRLNQPFFTAILEGRPFVILKAATSLDGRLAEEPGRRTPLTSEAAGRYSQFTRARVDAIAVGSETVLVDDPMLTARDVFRERPLTRVVFDRRLRTPPAARLLATRGEGPVVIMTTEDSAAAAPQRVQALEAAGATVLAVREPCLAPMLRRLISLDIQSVLLEGGAAVHDAAWREQVVDYVQLYVSPRALGTAGVPLLEHGRFSIPALIEPVVDVRGPDVIIEGYVHRAH